jgi:hypothetical protein
MDNLAKVMDRWEEVLNADEELKERNESIYSTVEGRTAIEIEVDPLGTYHVDVDKGRFKVLEGTGKKALLQWRVPATLFKEMLLGKQRLLYALLDEQGELSFDTPNFTHWNGATVIEILFLAQELTAKNGEVSRLVEALKE